jgi:HSP20 family molecular chaperone IbpA
MRVLLARDTMDAKGGRMTTLVKWAPFQDFDLIERRMWRTLQDIGMTPMALPAVDFYETDKELIVELDVPGFDEKELALEVTDHTLTIEGERAKEKEEKERTFYLTSASRSSSSAALRSRSRPTSITSRRGS